MTLWGTQMCISVPWVYSKNYFLFPATTLTHTSTLFLSCRAIHFLWLISCLLSLPISNLPHQSWAITKSILRQMLWTDTQQMHKYSRSKSLLFDPLVPGTRVLDIPRHLPPRVSDEMPWSLILLVLNLGSIFPSSDHPPCFSVGCPQAELALAPVWHTPGAFPAAQPRGRALLAQSEARPRLRPQAQPVYLPGLPVHSLDCFLLNHRWYLYAATNSTIF